MKRRALHIIVLLLLGAIVNVAVAWACWFWASQAKEMNAIEINPITVWQRYMPDSCEAAARLRNRTRAALRGAGGQIIQLTGKCSCSDAGIIVDLSSGWPFSALNGQMWVFSESRYSVKGLYDAHFLSDRGLVHDGQRAMLVPYVPLWPGFPINTIFYAAILWGVFFVPGKLKRTIRRRRGVCPACAYPVGTSPVCTECGGPVGKRPNVKTSKRPNEDLTPSA